jgi:hypothetical protein
MLNNLLVARAAVAERRHQFESEAEHSRLRHESRNVDSDRRRHARRNRHPVFRLAPRQAA